jgi:hypothetical protein
MTRKLTAPSVPSLNPGDHINLVALTLEIVLSFIISIAIALATYGRTQSEPRPNLDKLNAATYWKSFTDFHREHPHEEDEELMITFAIAHRRIHVLFHLSLTIQRRLACDRDELLGLSPHSVGWRIP